MTISDFVSKRQLRLSFIFKVPEAFIHSHVGLEPKIPRLSIFEVI